jgi:hypothetical protein
MADTEFAFHKRLKGKEKMRSAALYSIVGDSAQCFAFQTRADLDRAVLLFIFFPFRLL